MSRWPLGSPPTLQRLSPVGLGSGKIRRPFLVRPTADVLRLHQLVRLETKAPVADEFGRRKRHWNLLPLAASPLALASQEGHFRHIGS